MVTPLLWYTISLVVGILCSFSGYTWWFVVVAILGATFIAHSFFTDARSIHTFSPCVAALFFCVGITCTLLHTHRMERAFHTAHKGSCDLYGIVSQTYGYDDPRSFLLQVSQIKNSWEKEWHPTRVYATLRVCNEEEKAPSIGTKITVRRCFVMRPQNDSLYWHLVRNESLGYAKLQKNSIIYHPGQKSPWYQAKAWLAHQRDQALQRIRTHTTTMTYTLVRALFFGSKDMRSPEMHTCTIRFGQWGILHFLARSGLHLVVIIALLSAATSFMPVGLTVQTIIHVMIITLYAAITLPSVSFLRAYILFILYALCTLLRVPRVTIHLVHWATCCMLLLNPYHLFFLDFQLSFALVYALAWYGWYIQPLRTQ